MAELKRGFLLFTGKKNKIVTCEAHIANRVLYCNEHGKDRCRIAILLDQCEVLLEEDDNSFSIAVTGHHKRRSILRKARRRSKDSPASTNTYYFTANTKIERDEWVDAIAEAGKIYDSSSFKVLGQLTVEVLEGKDLAAKDFNLIRANSSDPYVVLKIDQQQHRTRTIKRNLNPKWNEEFSFVISHNEGVLFALIYDEDRLKKSDSMGQVVLPLSAMTRGEALDVWLPVLPRRPGEKVSGKVHVRCKYEYSQEDNSDAKDNIFGRELSTICDDQLCTNQIPNFFSNTLSFLEEKAINEEGIFRISGSATTIKELKIQIDAGKDVDYNQFDYNCVAGVFKLYLRELPIPLLHYDNYNRLIDISTAKEDEIIKELKSVLATLPPAHIAVLKLLLSSLKRFSDNSKANKMTIANLAIVFGPSLIRPLNDTLETAAHSANINILTEILIEYHASLFT